MRGAGSRLRFGIVVALLLSTGLLLQARRQTEKVPQSEKLAGFPMQVDTWRGQDLRLDPDVLQVLGPGDFLTRVYTQNSGSAYVDLFIAYFPSQKTGDTIHSPQNCLPGAGWTFTTSQRTPLQVSGRPPMTVNQYVISKGNDRNLVLYWYQAHGRVTPSEYWAKFYLVADAIRANRTDGALVRIVTPIVPGESMEAPEARAKAFAEQILPGLNRYIPD